MSSPGESFLWEKFRGEYSKGWNVPKEGVYVGRGEKFQGINLTGESFPRALSLMQ